MLPLNLKLARLIRRSLLPLFLATVLAGALAAQDSADGGAPTDRFLGTWKLNLDKSSSPPYLLASETITIQPEGKQYRITVESANRNGRGRTLWTLTDMKGWASTVTQVKGKELAIDQEWHVKRNAIDGFTILVIIRGPDGGSARSEESYTVSADGRVLTRRMISGALPEHRNQVLVFEKSP